MAEIRINATGGVKLYDADDSHYAQINAEYDRLQTEYDAQEYARNRKAEYPSIEEAVHAILDDDLENLQILRQAVKEKYPK